jgi:hypothetical protein
LIFTVATGCTGIAVQLRFSVSILPAGQSLERAEQELHKKKLQISGHLLYGLHPEYEHIHP